MIHKQKANNLSKKPIGFKLSLFLIGGIIAIFAAVALVSTRSASAACAAPSTNYGSATQSVSVPSLGTYHVWSRIMVPSSTSSSYLLEVDGGTCYVVGGGSAIAANTWTWVDYQNGTTSSKVDLANLSAGTHTLKLIGNAAGVKLDRILLLTDNSCSGANMPTGTGDNCLVTPPPPTNPPTTTLLASPTTVTQGQTVNLSATATDNASSPITKVDFYDGSTLIGTDTTSPYTLAWNTTSTTTTGTHSFTAKATDAVPLTGTSSAVTVTVNAAPPADTTPPTVSLTAPTNGLTVKGSTVGFTATSTDNTGGSGVKQVVFKVDGIAVGSPDTTSPYSLTWDSTTVPDGSHVITATSTDNANNTATSTGVTVTVSNVVPPPDTTRPTVTLTAPPSGQILTPGLVTISANASDNVAVANVTFSVDGVTVGNPDTTSPYSVVWDATNATLGNHTITALATDTSGNTATSQYAVSVQSPSDITPPTVPGNLTATATAYNQVNLSWAASTDNVGVVGYFIVRNGTTIMKTIGTGTTFADTTVSANTSYTYYVYAYDAAMNLSSNSNTATAMTLSPPDTQAPTGPTNLVATAVSTSQINLSWSAATDNVAVVSYLVFRNNSSTPIATVSTTSFGDTGLSAGTTYTYTVKAVDGANNTSIASNSASATTQTPPPPTTTGNLAGNVTTTTSSGNPYSCSSHPTLTALSAPSTDATILACSKRAQWFLNTLNNAGLTVDGWYGGNSSRAAANYQTKFGVTGDPSGTVGTNTWNSLESKGGSTTGFGSGTSISYADSAGTHTVTADNEGYYILTGIAPGNYSFTYSLQNYVSQTLTVTIVGNQTATKNVTLNHL
ncbi:MAG TPA: Ig-like domain-containing protein [Patescibacteria group bacterium]|nr:Ig-like domain-containing protein [Patescibacteria group bacterium]